MSAEDQPRTVEIEIEQDGIDSIYPRLPIPWNVGEPIEIGDVRDFIAFENNMPTYIDTTAQYAWDSRPNIGVQLRPKKPRVFNGIINDITLVPLTDPKAHLEAAETRILSIRGNSSGGIILADLDQRLVSRFIGFSFFAKAKSSRKSDLGIIKSAVVYAPAPLQRNRNQNIHKASVSRYPYGLRRFLLQPEIENEEEYEKLYYDSIKTAVSLQRSRRRVPGSIQQ